MKRISRPHTDEQHPDAARGLARWKRQLLAEQDPPLLAWAVVIALASIALIVGRDTSYQQLTIAILLTTVVLFVLLSLVEIIWRVLGDTFDSDGKTSGKRV